MSGAEAGPGAREDGAVEEERFRPVDLDTALAESVRANFGEGVEALDLRGAGVARVRGDLRAVGTLRRLVLAENRLTALGGLGDLGQLSHLDVADNQMCVAGPPRARARASTGHAGHPPA